MPVPYELQPRSCSQLLKGKTLVPALASARQVVNSAVNNSICHSTHVFVRACESFCRVHVRLGALLSDYKGLQEVTRMLGTPTIYGCFKCWHGGFWACRGKRIWCNHYARLPAGHVHRARLSSYHNPGVAPPPRTSREAPPRLRTRTELIRNVRHPIEPAPLIAGEPSPVVLTGEMCVCC